MAIGKIVRASTAADGTESYGGGIAATPAISADGRYVAFGGGSINLVPGDTNGKSDIFVKDLETGAIVRANTAADGTEANDDYHLFALSGNGRYVAFSSRADNLVPDDTNGREDLFVKDLETGAIVRANTAADGTVGTGQAIFPSLSGDGRYVSFTSEADNLVPGDTKWTTDVFVKDLESGEIIRIADSGFARLSYDGRHVLSYDGRHVAFVTDDRPVQVFVKDLETGAAVHASTSAGGTGSNALSTSPALSADGRYVSFNSSADNLVPGDTNGATDVFVKDLQTGGIVRASTAADGAQANAASLDGNLSADGRYVSFRSQADNLVPGETNGEWHVFVKDLQTGGIVRASTAADGAQGNAASYPGNLSSNGPSVVFSSYASNLVSGDTNRKQDVFVKDLSYAFSILGTPGDDRIDYVGGNDQGDGLDVLYAFPILGTPGDDVLVGTDNAEAIIGLAGDDRIDGLGGHDRLHGDGRFESTAACARVSFVGEDAGYRSTYGWYDTATLEAGILLANVDTATNPRAKDFTATLSLTGHEIDDLGFFLIPNGYARNAGTGEPFANGDGTDLNLEVFGDGGTWKIRDAETGHVFEGSGAPAYFSEAAKNPGSLDHAREEGSLTADGAVTYSWEDQASLGDQDFNDAVFQVEAMYTVEVNFQSEDAGYRSSYGYYDTGTGEAHLLVANVDTVTNPDIRDFTATLCLTDDEIDRLGFFLIPHGYALNSGAGEPLAGGADGTALDLEVFEDGGVWKIRDTETGHVFEGSGAPAYFSEAARNPGGLDHVMEEGDLMADGMVTHSWEDLPDLGDGDFNDAVFTVAMNVAGGGGVAGDDVLIGGWGDDNLTGGPGADTFHYERNDFASDVITDFTLGEDKLEFVGVGGADNPSDFDIWTEVDGGGDSTLDIRIAFPGIPPDHEMFDASIVILDVGDEIEALKADMLFA
jgi:Tol biopolymer transport system component